MIIYIYDIKNLQVVARPIVNSYGEFKAEPIGYSLSNNFISIK